MPEQTLAPVQEQTPVAKPEKRRERREETTLSEYLESLLVTVILALFGTTFIMQAFKIPSAFMEGTLLLGDHLLVNKFIFGGTGAWSDKFLPSRPLQRGDFMGRPFVIYWSVEAKSNDYTGESTFWSRLVGVFDTLAHLPSRTRWSRMLHTVH